jgi:hypothetical protein
LNPNNTYIKFQEKRSSGRFFDGAAFATHYVKMAYFWLFSKIFGSKNGEGGGDGVKWA